MKILHKFILKSYLGPFVMTFFIALFIILMQFLWKYIDDLVGKGLEWHIVAQLLFYASATFVPLALPLAILLSSLMTFGNMGEHFELVALKSSGISLQKFMKPLIVLSFIISLAAFYFSNNILPIANLKMGSLLYDVRQQKPALNIKEGMFYSGIDNFVIKVGKKERDGVTIHDVFIYDHSSRQGNVNMTYAESGRMETTEDEKYLVFTLKNGFNFTERADASHQRGVRPFQRIKFDMQIRKFDLTSFAMQRTNEEFFRDNFRMLNLNQLEMAIDSMEHAILLRFDEHKKTMLKRYKNFNVRDSIDVVNDTVSHKKFVGEVTDGVVPKQADEHESVAAEDTPQGSFIDKFRREILKDYRKSKGISEEDEPESEVAFQQKDTFLLDGDKLLENFSRSEQRQILQNALQSARNNKDYVYFANEDYKARQRSLNRHYIEWHRKFTLSFACLILFFIGAPLGAIIRKGGFGLPVVISVLFFVVYHVLSMTGEKFVRQGTVDPLQGMWMASVVLFPIGIFLAFKATTDSPILDVDTYLKFFKWLKKKNKN